MKLHCPKILLFSILLNILVSSSSNENNKNKPYITLYTSTTTSRVLSECDMQTSIYDNDPEMRSVKENFDRQTSQRFEEYEERMFTKRQKCKEQCDKDIQKIILKDKIETSLAEKVEKGCLKCGCGLGGVAASVGIIGPIAINEWTKAALLAAKSSAIAEGAIAGEAAGRAAGVAEVIKLMKSKLSLQNIAGQELKTFFTTTQYNDVSNIIQAVNMQYTMKCPSINTVAEVDKPFCSTIYTLDLVEGDVPVHVSVGNTIKISVENIVSDAQSVATTKAGEFATEQTAILQTRYVGAVDATYASSQTAIIASVVAILLIVLIMVIIYFILRYRRKKKMNKKQQYTKLLYK
ncbi:PIR protein, putative [Plasmodium sp.]|nr:PIR protein, putative [Plasmodium sp.]